MGDRENDFKIVYFVREGKKYFSLSMLRYSYALSEGRENPCYLFAWFK
jgi:hypothetical protein